MATDEYLFDGLKVLDVGTWIAGPVATTMLADFGADVIKVEMPGVGDGYRQFAGFPATPQSDVNYTWLMDARNKRSLTLNLKSQKGREILYQLVAECDVYVTNHPMGMRRNLGLTYEDLAAHNPSMIYASLTAYGEQGPERDREGFDLVAYWSRTGLMDLVRSEGAEPAHSLPGMGDHPTAVAMYANIVTALLRRERTGEGGLVQTSLIANGLWAASCVAQAKFCNADFTGYRDPARMPFSRVMYLTADDRWLQFTMVRTHEEFIDFLAALGASSLLQDARFATPPERLVHGAELIAELRPRLLGETSRVWMARFREAGVPASLVSVLDDLLEDPQLEANGIVAAPVEDVGTDRVITPPINVAGLAKVGIKKAPELGEHNQEILGGLGYDADAIQALADERVI